MCAWFPFLCSQLLKVFHYPVTVTVIQFAVGTVLVALMWTFNLYKRPKITGAQVFEFFWCKYWLILLGILVLFCKNTIFCIVSSQLAAILPLAAVAHTFGNLFTNMSQGFVRKFIKSQKKKKKRRAILVLRLFQNRNPEKEKRVYFYSFNLT